MHEIAYSRKALRSLERLPVNERRRIRSKIADYAAAPKAQVQHVKKLKGRDGYRLRIGNWRIIFEINGNVFDVINVGARGSIYG